MQQLTSNFLSQAVTVVLILALAFMLLAQKNFVIKLIGALILVLVPLVVLQSPALLATLAIAAAIYLIWRAIKRSRDEANKRRTCDNCGHFNHDRYRCT